ncbi:MAG: hypothetical protein LUC88_03495 [Prevotella sp.]|nr:hypothetical protein [Prevotella sp.]
MKYKTKIPLLTCFAIGTVVTVFLTSCGGNLVQTPADTANLAEFHRLSTEAEDLGYKSDGMALYVDYSTCIATGMSSAFYQKMVSPLTAATTEYWSIKGDSIAREDGSVYELLNNVKEINYAALDKAIELMAERDGESVMLTDGELFTLTSTKCNPNNPYMHDAFKKWLLKGHDIHILAEPYKESYKGKTFNKKRFYIIFTDDRVEGNIYDRIREIVNLGNFHDVDEFHLGGNYPWSVTVSGNHTQPNDAFAADVTPYGSFEIQEWQVGWKNMTYIIMNAVDDQGNLLPNGDKLISGMRINKNAFGCYRISDIDVRVTNINQDYTDYYNDVDAGNKVNKINLSAVPIENFIIVDKDEFKSHGNVDLYFDINNFAPKKTTELNGTPFNYFKIEIIVKDLENILKNSIDMFNFDSIVNEGQTNISISESLKNCVFDPDLLNQLKGKVLYTIYVKSDKY